MTSNNFYHYPVNIDALADRSSIIDLHSIHRRMLHLFLTAPPPVLQRGRQIGYKDADCLQLPSQIRYAEEEGDDDEDLDGPYSSAHDKPRPRFGNGAEHGQGYGGWEGRG